MTLVIKAREHKPIEIPTALVLENNRLDLFPDLQGEKFFKIKLRAGTLEVQPTGYIGFIPLNNRVAIEVEPRMPIANVEHLLARSKRSPAETLPYLRSFGETPTEATPFLQLLTSRYAALLTELRYEGVFKTYAAQKHVGSSPSGRIHPLPTALRSKSTRRAIVVFERFDRTIDNPANRVILAAGRKLLCGTQFFDGRQAKLMKEIERDLEMLDGVKEVSEPEVPRLDGLPEQRPYLRQLLALSGVILREQGVRLRGEGLLRLPTFLIKMEDVFEDYARIVLQESTALDAFEIRNGNNPPPVGAAIKLFSVAGPLGNRDATPDIVISKGDVPICVVEVKYKPCDKHPERDNLNQLLTYALAYNVKMACLLYPAMEKQATGLTHLGIVEGVSCFRALLDLSLEEIKHEEAVLCSEIAALLAAYLRPGPQEIG